MSRSTGKNMGSSAAGDAEALALFKGLTDGPLPPGVAQYILGGLRVEQARRPRRWESWRQAVWAAEALPVLVSLTLAVVLVVFWAFQGGRGAGVSSNGLPEAWEAIPAWAMNDAVATVEDIRSPTAEILAFSVPGKAGSTEVIFIVDRSMDL
ncbi:MAG: hypothetical protein ACE5HD_09620 [Acidobacteriota bacterium]